MPEQTEGQRIADKYCDNVVVLGIGENAWKKNLSNAIDAAIDRAEGAAIAKALEEERKRFATLLADPETVEKVARVICKARGHEPDNSLGKGASYWHMFQDSATAAINAFKQETKS